MRNNKEYLVSLMMSSLKVSDKKIDYVTLAKETMLELDIEEYSLSEIAESSLEAYYTYNGFKSKYKSFIESNKKDLMESLKSTYKMLF